MAIKNDRRGLWITGMVVEANGPCTHILRAQGSKWHMHADHMLPSTIKGGDENSTNQPSIKRRTSQ